MVPLALSRLILTVASILVAAPVGAPPPLFPIKNTGLNISNTSLPTHSKVIIPADAST